MGRERTTDRRKQRRNGGCKDKGNKVGRRNRELKMRGEEPGK